MKNNLKKIREGRGISAQALADLADTTKQQIYRLEKGERKLTVEWMERIAPHLGCKPYELMPGTEGEDNFTLNVTQPVRLDKVAAVKGEVSAGVWLEHEFMDDDKYPPVAASTNPKYSGVKQYALRVKGDSMDKYVKDGDHVICVDFANSGEAIPEDNKVVVVRRERAGTTEHSLKRVRRLGNGDYELWPESNNPLFQKPLDLAHNDEGTTVTITGLVIGRNLND